VWQKTYCPLLWLTSVNFPEGLSKITIKVSITMGYLVKFYQDTRQEEYRLHDDVGAAVWILLWRGPKYATVILSVCHCTLISMPLYFYQYAIVLLSVCHCTRGSMPLYSYQYGTILLSICHCTLTGMPLYSYQYATVLLSVCHCTLISYPASPGRLVCKILIGF
jgi:hypothetical protein